MKNPCLKCREEGLINVKPLVITNILNKFYKVKVNGIETTLCDYHLEEALNNINILEISEIEGTRIIFKNLTLNGE